MSPHRCSPFAGRRGFTLVEFLVAIAIGLVVSLVIGQIFVGSRQSFSSQEDLARVQENMRSASQILSRTIRMAGYRNNPGVDPSQVFPQASTPAINGADNVATAGFTAGREPDTITVRYQGAGSGAGADGSVVNCLGVAVDFGAMSSNTFAIRENGRGDGKSLFCSTDGGLTWPAANELVPDIEAMQILYGVDRIGNDTLTVAQDGAPDYYVRISNVSDIDQIVSVRVWLLLRSPSLTNAAVDTLVYNLAGVNYGPFNDRYVRRAMFTTISMRNRNP